MPININEISDVREAIMAVHAIANNALASTSYDRSWVPISEGRFSLKWARHP